MLRAKGCCARDVLKEHQEPLHAAGGHVKINVPEGVALIFANLSVPQNPVVQDRAAAVVLTGDHAGQLRLSDNFPANMYIWDPYGQNLGIYPIRVLHGPHIGFLCPYKTYIGPILVNFDQQTRIYGNQMGRFGAFIPFGSYLGPI